LIYCLPETAGFNFRLQIKLLGIHLHKRHPEAVSNIPEYLAADRGLFLPIFALICLSVAIRRIFQRAR
jgi:hypothetical protein